MFKYDFKLKTMFQIRKTRYKSTNNSWISPESTEMSFERINWIFIAPSFDRMTTCLRDVGLKNEVMKVEKQCSWRMGCISSSGG